MPTTIEDFLAPRTPTVRDLALQTCALIREIMPGAIEVVRPGRNNITFARGDRMAEWVYYVSPFKSHVNLGFLRGTEMPDPEGLMEGTGMLLRHVKIRSAADLARPALRALVAVARDA